MNDYTQEELDKARAEEWQHAFEDRHSRSITLHIELQRAYVRIKELEEQLGRKQPDTP